MNWAISPPLAAGTLVELMQQRRLALGRHLLGPALDRQRRGDHGPQRARLAALAAQRRRGLVGGALEVGGIEAVDVGEEAVPPSTTRTPAPSGTGLDRLDPRLVDRDREAVAAFGEDLGEAAAVGERPRQDALGNGAVDQLTHAFGRFPATSIRRPAATNSSAPAVESSAWSALRPFG